MIVKKKSKSFVFNDFLFTYQHNGIEDLHMFVSHSF